MRAASARSSTTVFLSRAIRTSTNDPTNMAIEGNGFFVVQNASGQTFLTRAGSFEPDAQGNLVNASGYTLMGYPPVPSPPSYSPNDLVPVQVSTSNSFAGCGDNSGDFDRESGFLGDGGHDGG